MAGDIVPAAILLSSFVATVSSLSSRTWLISSLMPALLAPSVHDGVYLILVAAALRGTGMGESGWFVEGEGRSHAPGCHS